MSTENITGLQDIAGSRSLNGISRSDVMAAARLLSAVIGKDIQVRWSNKLKSFGCYHRKLRVTLSDELIQKEGMDAFLHLLAHERVLDKLQPRPHGEEFRDTLEKLREVWYGKEKGEGEPSLALSR